LNRYERNYRRIVELVPDVVTAPVETLWRLSSGPFMDLVVEVIGRSDTKVLVSMSHSFVQNGDLMMDPEMEVELSLRSRTANAHSFLQSSTGYRCLSYPRPGFVDPRALRENNAFLDSWLGNLKAQGHRVADVDLVLQ
jgi:uncharacterized protein YqiB (DUF1249 family)